MQQRKRVLSPLAMQRMARGIKQRTLATLMDVKPSSVSSWESGRNMPDPEKISKLAQHLGVDPLRCVELINSVQENAGH